MSLIEVSGAVNAGQFPHSSDMLNLVVSRPRFWLMVRSRSQCASAARSFTLGHWSVFGEARQDLLRETLHRRFDISLIEAQIDGDVIDANGFQFFQIAAEEGHP